MPDYQGDVEYDMSAGCHCDNCRKPIAAAQAENCDGLCPECAATKEADSTTRLIDLFEMQRQVGLLMYGLMLGDDSGD